MNLLHGDPVERLSEEESWAFLESQEFARLAFAIAGEPDIVQKEYLSEVAEIVRDLWRREQDRGLSAGEKRMLTRARRVLVDELSLAQDTDEARADLVLPARDKARRRPVAVPD